MISRNCSGRHWHSAQRPGNVLIPEDARAVWTSLLRSWERSLRAQNLSGATISKYAESGRQLVEHLLANGNIGPEQIARQHVEEFIAHLAATRSAATTSVRYRSVQQLFAYLLDEEEIASNPMVRMRPPIVPERPVPVLSLDDARRLLKACDGKDFVSRRDTAILRLFLDTGMRLAELSALRCRRRGTISCESPGSSLPGPAAILLLPPRHDLFGREPLCRSHQPWHQPSSRCLGGSPRRFDQKHRAAIGSRSTRRPHGRGAREQGECGCYLHASRTTGGC